MESLNAGQEFEELSETYVIFVTEHDFFGKGAGLYPIERMNLVTGERFNDREHILYVNAQYQANDDLGRLMHDFLCNDPADMHYDILAQRARYFKENPKGVSEMCKAMEDMRNEALEQGHILTLIESVRNIKKNLGLSDQQVKDAMGISAEDWKAISARI